MAAPDWFGSNPDPVSVMAQAGPARIADASVGLAQKPSALAGASESLPSAAALSSCTGLLDLSAAVLGRCGTFFDPVVLAQLDAALAHELAQQARIRADEADGAVELAISEGRQAEALAYLAQRASAAKAVATKARSQAAMATDVMTAVGGVATAHGFDPDVVDRVSGAALIDVIAALEEAKNAISAVQAQTQTLFVAKQRLEQARAGIPQQKLGAGIAQQVGLARHESPHRGRQLCELAEVLVREMPCSMKTFSAGQISEYRVSLVARETAFLSLEDRLRVDELICGDPSAAALLGTREVSAASRKAAYELDPEVFVKRHEKAVGDRYVSLRPAADGMTFLTALIPLKQGVRILATLTRVAGSAKVSGDERGKGQIMADALMHRLIQHAPCDNGAGGLGDHRGMPWVDASAPTPDGAGPRVPREATEPEAGPLCSVVGEPDIALELIMTDRSLFGGASDPAVLVGYDPIPAPIARMMILGDGDGERTGSDSLPRVWLKRLFTHPGSNMLLAMDSRSRFFPEGMKEFLRLRDQRCRTSYCDAPIREYDHIKAYAAGGATAIENGQGLCSDCNQAKEAPGWSFEPGNGLSNGPPGTEISTPTNHRYVSTAPPLPGPAGIKPGSQKNRQR
ncbi:HNH endonuclease [Arthrobacter sp. HLT1-20]